MTRKIYLRIFPVIAACLLALTPSVVKGQNQSDVIVSGNVSNSYGEALAGVVIETANGKNQTISLSDGTYILTIKDNSERISFHMPGYKRVSLDTPASTVRDIILEDDPHGTDLIVDLGYTKQNRNSVTGAVSSVSGSVLGRAPVSYLSQAMAGRFTGLTSRETSSELANVNVENLIRGLSTINGREPLIVIDGFISRTGNWNMISPQEIETVTILKDASATAIYGIEGGNGVIVITTKRGYSGDLRVNVTFDQSFQQMTRRPSFVNSAEYATLRNQAAYNDGRGAYAMFSQAEIDHYRTGDNLTYYPDNNWYDMYIRDFTNMQRAGIDVSGGSDAIKYYSNINFMHQTQPFKIAEKQDYDPTPQNMWFNFRSNLDIRINKYLSGFLLISGNVQRNKSINKSNSEIYSSIFNLPPTMYGPLSPAYDDPVNPGNVLGDDVVTLDGLSDTPYGMINRSGYQKQLNTNIMAQAGLTVDLNTLVKGLSLTGIMGYQTNSTNMTTTHRDYARVVRSADMTTFNSYGSAVNSPLTYNRSKKFLYNMNFTGRINYERSWGDHSVDAMAYSLYTQEDTDATSGAQMLLYRRLNMGVSAIYGFRNTYFIKGDLGYSGSDQFHRDNRFLATPSISAAWVISNEDFMSDLKWMSYLKVRASYGLTANDQLGTSQRYLFQDDITVSTARYNEGLRGNPWISAEKIRKQNYGIDIGIGGFLDISVDYYRELNTNMFISMSNYIPEYQGRPSDNIAKSNNGKMENSGFEIAAFYNKRINNDWSVWAGLNFSTNKNKVLEYNEPPYPDTYAYTYGTTGYSWGQQWGYLIDYSNGNGYFNTQAELDNSGLNYTFGTPRLGDFIYVDLNGDGYIDARDQTTIGYSNIPRQTFSLSGGFSWRGLDMSFMFQGVNKVSEMVSANGYYAHAFQSGLFTDVHKNAWTAERYAAGEKIDRPALTISASTSDRGNAYYIMDRSYIRLKNIEIGYTMPLRISSAISAQKIRFKLQGQNLATWDKMKSKYTDPENGNIAVFQPYRVYSVGVSLIF